MIALLASAEISGEQLNLFIDIHGGRAFVQYFSFLFMANNNVDVKILNTV